MSAVERSTSEFDRQLLEYLLSTHPACLTIVGQPLQAQNQPSTDTQEALRVLQFDTFADCDACGH